VTQIGERASNACLSPKESVGRDQSLKLRERPATDRMCLPRKPMALCIGESQTLVAQAGFEKSVLRLQVVDYF
jgi:hypothetical protein